MLRRANSLLPPACANAASQPLIRFSWASSADKIASRADETTSDEVNKPPAADDVAIVAAAGALRMIKPVPILANIGVIESRLSAYQLSLAAPIPSLICPANVSCLPSLANSNSFLALV